MHSHSTHTLRIATRQSPLALLQAQQIVNKLQQHHGQALSIEIIPFVTAGDRVAQKSAIMEPNNKGLFVKELEVALMHQHADFAVHSLKDVPIQLPDGLILSTICKRDNPLDVLISKGDIQLMKLPPHAVIGTSSLRRKAQILACRHDIQVHEIRGNINTRLLKLHNANYNAIILAAAGFERMGWEDKISERLVTPIFLPACGQGALALECRINDSQTRKLLEPLHDRDTAICIDAERYVNSMLGGSCNTPLAIYCQINPLMIDQLILQVKVMSHDGTKIIAKHVTGSVTAPLDLAKHCVMELIEAGANELLV